MEGFITAAAVSLGLAFGFSVLAAVIFGLLKKKEEEKNGKEEVTAFADGLPLPSDFSQRGKYEGPASCAARLALAENRAALSGCCLGEGDCLAVCRSKAICLENGCPVINPGLCSGCGACHDVCPQGIITMKPRS